MTQENKPEYPINNPINNPTNKNPREIEAAIGETRAALTDDIKALSDKASPANVKHEIKQEIKQAMKTGKDAVVEKAVDTATEVKDAAVEAKNVVVDKAIEVKDVVVEKAQQAAETVSETAAEVGEQAQRAGKATWEFVSANFVPLALLGLGAGWMISNQRKTRRVALPRWQADADRDYPEYGEDELYDDSMYATRGTYPAGSRSPAMAPRTGRTKRTSVTPTTQGAGYTSEDRPTNGQPRSALREAGASISRGSRAAYDKAGETVEQAEHSISDGYARSRDFVKEKYALARTATVDFAGANPLALALGTLVAGVGIGLLLPGTRREDEWLKPSRQRAKRAIGNAREAADDVRRVAKQTARDTFASIDGPAH